MLGHGGLLRFRTSPAGGISDRHAARVALALSVVVVVATLAPAVVGTPPAGATAGGGCAVSQSPYAPTHVPEQLDNAVAACISAPSTPHTVALDAYLTLNPQHWPCTVHLWLSWLNPSDGQWWNIRWLLNIPCPTGPVIGTRIPWGQFTEPNGTYRETAQVRVCDPVTGTTCWWNVANSPLLFFTGGIPD